jgi:chitosanase
VKNLARHKTATTSSGAKASPIKATDGDLFQGWNGDKQGEQWLTVDLAAEQSVGAASLTWSKAYARAYAIQVSHDGAQWREVFRQPKKTGYAGDTDAIQFTPTKARHVRLLCQERGTDWGGYTVHEFGVYELLPSTPSILK